MSYPDGTNQAHVDAVDLDSAAQGKCDNCGADCLDLSGGRDQYVNERLVAVPAICCCCRYSQDREWLGDRAVLDACESCDSRVRRDVRGRA